MPRHAVSTSAGPVELPILQKESSLVGLTMRVDLERARECVPPPFEPWPMLGKALAAFSTFEYRESSIGPYRELSVGVFVRRKGSSPSWLRFLRDPRSERDAALYIVNLPVTTEIARAAGVEIWGFPKYVAEIETRFRPDHVYVRLGGEVEVRVNRHIGPKAPGMAFTGFSVKDRRIIRTVLENEDVMTWGWTPRVSIEVLGEGPTASTVSRLGLDKQPSAFVFCTDRMRLLVPAGEDVGPA
jgi:hypothetical protein